MELERKVLQECPVPNGSSEAEPRASSSIQSYLEERRFSKEEYLNIIEGAELLRQIEAQKGKRVEELLERFPTEEKLVPLSRIYALAKELDIDLKYVERYMSLRFPSPEQQWRDLQKYDVKMSESTVCSIYKRELEKAIVQAFPHESFSWGYSSRNCVVTDAHFVRINRRLKRAIFGRNRLVEVPEILADLLLYHPQLHLHLTVHDPSFLRVTGLTLTRLNETFPYFPLRIESCYNLELPNPLSSSKKSQ